MDTSELLIVSPLSDCVSALSDAVSAGIMLPRGVRKTMSAHEPCIELIVLISKE